MSLERFWYSKNPLAVLLLPVSWLFFLLAYSRKIFYRAGVFKQTQLNVPVIIAGNITVGGTGKTPLVLWLVEYLRKAGFTPGIISRGYRGKATQWPQAVSADSDPVLVGDEPVLLARRAACPVYVGPDRVEAAQALLENSLCDVLISDDGLQHYALGRTIELAVVDGVRRYGNGFYLPAGPLREPVSRLASVDAVIVNGGNVAEYKSGHEAFGSEFSMNVCVNKMVNMHDSSQQKSISSLSGSTVHAVAGIGYPKRFFSALKAQNINVIEHVFTDHHAFTESDLMFDDDLPVLMTEKDAVKCHFINDKKYWYVIAVAELDQRFDRKMNELLKLRPSPQTS